MKNLKNKIGAIITATMLVGVGSVSTANAASLDNEDKNSYFTSSKDKMKNQSKKIDESKFSASEVHEMKNEIKKMKFERFEKKMKLDSKYKSNYKDYHSVKMNKNTNVKYIK